MRATLVVLALLLASCNNLNAFGFTNGTRLKALALEHEGGATQWSGQVIDSKLGNCQFAEVGDKILCVPAAFATYSDATCQTPVFLVYNAQCSTSKLPTHVTVIKKYPTFDNCAQPLPHLDAIEVRPLGSALNTTSSFSLDNNGACVAAFNDLNNKLYSLGAPVAADELVSGTMKSESRDNGLFVDYIEATDGSRFWVQARDEKLGTCDFQALNYSGVNPATNLLCVPTNVAYQLPGEQSGYFEGTSCNGTSLAYQSTNTRSCAPAAILSYGAPPKCGPYPISMLAVGDAVPAAGVGEKQGTEMCVAPPANYKFFKTGTTIDAATFKTATLQSSKHKGLLVQQVTTSSGQLLRSNNYGFIDPGHNNANCNPLEFADGKLRCVPGSSATIDTSPTSFHAYSDAACTSELFQYYTNGCDDRANEYRTIIQTAAPIVGACVSGLPTKVFAVGTKHTGAVYGKFGEGGCIALGSTTGSVYFPKGEDITASLAVLTQSK